MIVGAVVFGLTFRSARIVPMVLATLMVVVIVSSPLLPRLLPEPLRIAEERPLLTASGVHRLIIWRFTSERIAERPAFGWGLNSSQAIPGSEGVFGPFAQALPLHPHNAALQLWLELGVVGAALGSALIATIFVAIRRTASSPADTAFAWALVLAAMVICSLSYGIWQTWWLAALWFAATFAIRPAQSETPQRVRAPTD